MTGPTLPSLVLDHGDALAEARACRARAALFDFSFIHRARLAGPRAADDIERFCARRLADLAPGHIRYALRRDADGAVGSDLTVWRTDATTWEVMSGRDTDIPALGDSLSAGTHFTDLSAESAVFAVQGPHALAVLAPFVEPRRLAALPYYACTHLPVAGIRCLVGRLGYTGERGFEVIAPAGAADGLWQRLATAARPAGFAAIDMLRIEAGFVLFTHECRVRPTAAELGLGRLCDGATATPRMCLAGFRADVADRPLAWRPERTPPPPAAGTLSVTSASWSVHAGAVLGLGFVTPADSRPGTRLAASEQRLGTVEVVPLPWFDPGKRRPRGRWNLPPFAPAM